MANLFYFNLIDKRQFKFYIVYVSLEVFLSQTSGRRFGVFNYTQKALDFAARNSSLFKYTYSYKYKNARWYLNYCKILGGYFNSSGKIVSFWWF